MPLRRRILCAKRTFDCTLRGPFDNLCFTRLSATRALCKSIITVISASTVSSYNHILIKSFLRLFVNSSSYIHPEYRNSSAFYYVIVVAKEYSKENSLSLMQQRSSTKLETTSLSTDVALWFSLEYSFATTYPA